MVILTNKLETEHPSETVLEARSWAQAYIELSAKNENPPSDQIPLPVKNATSLVRGVGAFDVPVSSQIRRYLMCQFRNERPERREVDIMVVDYANVKVYGMICGGASR